MHLGRTSCDKVHELQWRHWRISNNREGTLSAFLATFIHVSNFNKLSDVMNKINKSWKN